MSGARKPHRVPPERIADLVHTVTEEDLELGPLDREDLRDALGELLEFRIAAQVAA